MNKPLRVFLAAAAVMVVLIGVMHFQPSWAASMNSDCLNLGDLEERIGAQLRRDQELDEHLERSRRRLADRQRIVTDLIDGNTTLLLAAEELKSINQGLPEISQSHMGSFGGNSEGERLCRYAIHFVILELYSRTEHPDTARIDQLEGELKTLFQPDGTVHLPPE
jgi:hypothetical protein